VLADVVVAGVPIAMDLPTTLPPGPLVLIRTEELTGTKRITFLTQAPATGGDDFRSSIGAPLSLRYNPHT